MAQLLDITPAEYHALDAFSSSVAKTVIKQSPAHARAGFRKTPTKPMESGDILHHLVLGKGKDFEPIDAKDYKTDKAKAARDAAREAGKVPVLVADLEEYRVTAEKVRQQLADRGIVLDGRSEQAITWIEHTEFGDVPCKALLDHVWEDKGLILDLKMTADASPAAVERTSENLGYGIQRAAYTRALVALRPEFEGKAGFAFAFCEYDDPWAINVAEPDGLFCELGERRWLRAVREWAKCRRDNVWPSYGTAINPLSAPTWALSRESLQPGEQ